MPMQGVHAVTIGVEHAILSAARCGGPSCPSLSIRSSSRSSSTGCSPSSRRWARRCCAPRIRRSSNSSRDFSTAICDLDGRLIAQAEHVPIHVGALPFAARAMTEFFRGDIHPGDVFLLNDPYHGGNHLPDLTASCRSSKVMRRASGRSTGRTRAISAARRTVPTTQRDRHLAGRHPHHAAQALRPRRTPARRDADDRDQCPSSRAISAATSPP